MGTETKNFNNSMTGAPVLNGTLGSMIGLLDALLVNGFGLQTATSVVITGGIAVATLPTTPAAQVDTVLLLAGATPAGLNGEKRVLAVTANTVSFATTEANGTATGTITVKVAPLGWLKPFTGTNLAVYQPGDTSGTNCLLRVDDTVATTCRVRGYESMSSVSVGTGPFPSEPLYPGGGYWPKSSTADATARAWWLVGDGRMFYVFLASGAAGPTNGPLFGFGDILSNRSSDPYASILTTGPVGVQAIATALPGCFGYGGEAVGYTFLARSHTGMGGAITVGKRGAMGTAAAYSGTPTYTTDTLTYPNGSDNGLLVTPVNLVASLAVRGTLPGLLHSPLQIGSAFQTGDKVTGTGAFSGRKLLALRCGVTLNTTTYGTAFLDLTGPWR